MQREYARAALALILGPETTYQMRIRATRRLIRQGPEVLPLVLNTLSTYPEITDPAWPWWPPQYEHLSRLLLHLSSQAHLSLPELLTHPLLEGTPGPVLWTTLMETAGRLPHENNEPLLRQGLKSHWMQVRYAAAMSLALKAKNGPLQSITRTLLQTCQHGQEALPVRLATTYALISCGEQAGIEHLIYFLLPCIPAEVRKAATFILATELPMTLTQRQRNQITYYLLKLIADPESDIAQHAAHALSKIATPSHLPALYAQLEAASTPTQQILILSILEEIAQRKHIRYRMRQQAMPTRLLPQLQSPQSDVCRQACYTLAACGGKYAAAMLGTLIVQNGPTGKGEALESIRFLRGALRVPLRAIILRWLVEALHSQEDMILVTTLDTLTQLLWQARRMGAKKARQEICTAIVQDGILFQLLSTSNVRVQQHVLELLPALPGVLQNGQELHAKLQELLLRGSDSGVRACTASILARTNSRWAIPFLLRALLDPDKHVTHTALNTLAQIATPDDSIVVYVVAELIRLEDEADPDMNSLAREAERIIGKWKKERQDQISTKLHEQEHPPIV